MKKKYKMIFLICIVILVIGIISNICEQKNLIFMNEREKKELLELLRLNNNTESFQPINYRKRKTELGSTERVKVIKFNISKKDYENNQLKYENNPELIDRGLITDKGDYYECELQISKYNNKYNYEKINPKSQINQRVEHVLQFLKVIYIMIAIIIVMCKEENLHKVLKVLLVVVPIITILAHIYIQNIIK